MTPSTPAPAGVPDIADRFKHNFITDSARQRAGGAVKVVGSVAGTAVGVVGSALTTLDFFG